MDASRAQKIAQVLKDTRTLGKDIGKPVAGPAAAAAVRAATEATSRLPIGSIGGTVMKYLLYLIATFLAIGLLVLAIDQWVTPIFKRLDPSLPGIDKTQVFWTNTSSVAPILVGTPPPGSEPNASTPYVSILQGQESYAFTADVLITDEFPKTLPGGVTDRTFLVLRTPTATFALSDIHSKIEISLNNTVNTVKVTVCSGSASGRVQESAEIENVPIHTSFRIGVVKTPSYMDVYLNGKLYKTRKLLGTSAAIATGDTIYPPSSIKITSGSTTTTLSTGIKVLNFRAFGYVPEPSEMLSRMNDLIPTASFSS
jgi:hypothetical protein